MGSEMCIRDSYRRKSDPGSHVRLSPLPLVPFGFIARILHSVLSSLVDSRRIALYPVYPGFLILFIGGRYVYTLYSSTHAAESDSRGREKMHLAQVTAVEGLLVYRYMSCALLIRLSTTDSPSGDG